MSDSFADLWSFSAPSSSKSTPPPKLGASLASSPAPQSKPRNDVFSLLAATSSNTPPIRATASPKIEPSTITSRSLTPSSNSRSLTPSINPRSTTPSQPFKSSDAFADLISTSSFTTSGANMTIAERAREVERQRMQAEAQRQATVRKQASAWDGLDALGSGGTHIQDPHIIQEDDWGLGNFAASTSMAGSSKSDHISSSRTTASQVVEEDDWGLGDFVALTPEAGASKSNRISSTHRTASHVIDEDDWGLGDFPASMPEEGSSNSHQPLFEGGGKASPVVDDGLVNLAVSTPENGFSNIISFSEGVEDLADFAAPTPAAASSKSTQSWADLFSDQNLSTTPPSSSPFSQRHKVDGVSSLADSSPDRDLSSASASSSALALAARYRIEGTVAYKLGQFSAAESAYSRGIASLPRRHLELIPLYNNRAQAKLKGGDYKGACEDCTSVVDIIGQKYRPIDMQELEGSGIGAQVNVPQGFIKAVKRRAEAYEGRERWVEARQDWELLSSMDWIPPTVRGEAARGIGRCRRMISSNGGYNPSKPAAPKRNSKPMPNTPITPQPTSSAAPGTALANYRSITSAAEAEDQARHELKDSVDARLLSWKAGKETNIRALLSSLDTVLWPGLGLQRMSLADIVTPSQVKVRYMKAIAKIHPDKLNASNSTVEQRMLANGVFGMLNEAWNTFKP